ncbi:hypothetical protein [Alkalicoccus luteus]|uniref:SLH domain-containing protein n=1 Tax=Alkalicoccus luteus TaxID=1237094 RepID=A0A969TWQ8_9BACI|nr:hypothetical protein [Alkalicoccus luteus]NJP37509.1 hypothetical protein [Alkalicoccus luteus]
MQERLMMVIVFITALCFIGFAPASAAEDQTDFDIASVEDAEPMYDKKVMRAVRESLGLTKHDSSQDESIGAMSQVEVMDRYLTQTNNRVKGQDAREAVKLVFDVDISLVSRLGYGNTLVRYDPFVMGAVRQSLGLQADDTSQDAAIMNMKKNHVMDRVIRFYNDSLSGAEIRQLINYVFGINLDGISGLEGAQVGIFSKGQWIIKEPDDLLVISSSPDDVELYVSLTDYYRVFTGSDAFPEALAAFLEEAGFSFSSEKDRYEWINPDGVSAPDPFKGQIIGQLLETVQMLNQ